MIFLQRHDTPGLMICKSRMGSRRPMATTLRMRLTSPQRCQSKTEY
jgi:hypothetical protein